MTHEAHNLVVAAERLLSGVVETARGVLADLDDEEIPPRLRRVASSTGGRLPPPFARLLLQVLDEEPWLRERVAEAHLNRENGDRAGRLFLTRPEGWPFELGMLAGRELRRGEQAEAARLQRRVEELVEEVAEGRRRLQSAQREIDDTRAGTDRRVEEATERLSARTEAARRRAVELEIQLADQEKELATARLELHEERHRVAILRDRLESPRDGAVPPAGPAPEVWSWRDPVDLARVLDQLSEAARPSVRHQTHRAGAERGPVSLPAGLRPDRAEALEWLVRSGGPLTLVVDGYNVTHLLSERHPVSAAVRRRLERELATLARRRRSGWRVIVVYDSSGGGGPRTSRRGIEVRFTEGETADDHIELIARSRPGPMVAITSDRELQGRVAEAGGLVLWSQALVEWIRRPA